MPVSRRTRPRIEPYDLVAYSVAAISLVAGIAVFALRQIQPPEARYTFGTLLVLMAIYRIVHTRSRATQRRWEAEFEAFREEQERNRPTEL
jgi:small neutral amino acid transporter SnatA (MarC family)